MVKLCFRLRLADFDALQDSSKIITLETINVRVLFFFRYIYSVVFQAFVCCIIKIFMSYLPLYVSARAQLCFQTYICMAHSLLKVPSVLMDYSVPSDVGR